MKTVLIVSLLALLLAGCKKETTAEPTNEIPIPMVAIAGDTYQMGSLSGNMDERPPHSATINSFHIDATEITHEKWTAVCNWGLTNGYSDLPAGQNDYYPIGVNTPVTDINWYDALKWCNARSEMDGLAPVYYTSNSMAMVYRTGEIDLSIDAVKWTANGYRLPTEAEWEFAARGGTKSKGYIYSGSDNLDSVAWYHTNSANNTRAVSTKGANELGLYDMSGNVNEWCWDWYALYSGYWETDPKGPTSGKSRVKRGGSFFTYGVDVVFLLRIPYRQAEPPTTRFWDIGFRCVRGVK